MHDRMEQCGWCYLQIKLWHSSWQMMDLMCGLPIQEELNLAVYTHRLVQMIQLFSLFLHDVILWISLLNFLMILFYFSGFLELVMGWISRFWSSCYISVCAQSNWTTAALCCSFTGIFALRCPIFLPEPTFCTGDAKLTNFYRELWLLWVPFPKISWWTRWDQLPCLDLLPTWVRYHLLLQKQLVMFYLPMWITEPFCLCWLTNWMILPEK